MTVKVVDAHDHVSSIVSIVKLATVLEDGITIEQCSVVIFCGQ
jgi:hypothetical protein